MPDLLLGLDIGTQAIKGIIVDKEGNVRASAAYERGPQHPAPGWVEMDAERDWWRAGLQVIREMLSAEHITASDIAVVGVSALVPCLCALDECGSPLRPAILYSDNRALQELQWVNRQTGFSLTAQAVIPKLLWIKNHEPGVFRKIRTILSAHNYFVYRLTGSLCMDPDTASVMGGIYIEEERDWSTSILDSLNLSVNLWPEIRPATALAGRITSEAAALSGLYPGTPVITGTGDTFPTIVGCGAVESGDAMISFGTTGLLTVTNSPLVNFAEGPHFNSGAQGDSITWGANILSAGRLVRWYRDQFANAEMLVAERLAKDPFSIIEEEAAAIPAGAQGLIVLPHWLGRRTPTPDANLKGALLGLTPSHTSSHIYRAILESFAYNIRQGFDQFKPGIKRVVATAGGARSRLWRQIVADVLNMPLEYHPQAAGAMGIAFLAAYAQGLVEDFSSIKTEWLVDSQRTLPDASQVEIYRKIFPVYCEFDRAVAQPFAHLAEI